MKLFIGDGLYADFLIKLKYDKINQANFFRTIIEFYLKDDPLIRKIMQNIQIKHEKIINNKKVKKDLDESKQTIQDYALDKNEIENIFDILESEMDDEPI